MSTFAAVLLAGGQSRRMGRDKALLPLADGRPLWQRQLAVLRELSPAELFISGPARDGFPADVPLLADETPGLGPLAGITSALAAMRSPRLVVLAVDLPNMTAAYLRGLLGEACGGVIPLMEDGFLEPLAAVYPHTELETATRQLQSSDRSLQTFARHLLQTGHSTARPVSRSEAGLFANWNRPGDVAAAQ